MRTKLLAVSLLLAVACSSSSAPERRNYSGIWDGHTRYSELYLTLLQRGDSLSGSGAFIAGGTTYFIVDSLRGSASGSEFSLHMFTRIGNEPVEFRSTEVEADRIAGTVSGDGLIAEPIVLARH